MESSNIVSGPPEVEGPLDISYSEYLFRRLRCGGDNVAQICANTGERTTYAEILQKCVNLTESLKHHGVKKGDVVAMSCENRFEFSICAIAIMFSGAVNATLNTMYTKDELLHALNISKPKMIICSSSTIKNMKNVRESMSSIQKLILIDNDKSETGVIFYDDLVKEDVDISRYRMTPIDIHDPLVILCSSGTTGLPKGVVITHHNVSVCNGHLGYFISQTCPISKHCLLSVMPWFHAYGFVSHIIALNLHLKYAFLFKFADEPFLKAIQDYRVTLIFLAPPLMVFLAKHPLVANYDLSSLTEIWCGAAPLSKASQQAVIERIGVKKIHQGYGLTETTLAVLHTNMAKKSKVGSSGKCVPGTKLKIVDLTTGEALGPYKQGELCIKSPLVMAGYLGDSSSTRLTIDSEGWLHSGDIAYYDDERYFYIVDRLKELIKYKGFQVPPAEIEAVLLQNPEIKDAGVIGIPDEVCGELSLAFVVRQPGSALTEQQIKDYVSQKISYHKRLHGGVIFVEEIPKNPSGKILRRELKVMLEHLHKSKL